MLRSYKQMKLKPRRTEEDQEDQEDGYKQVQDHGGERRR